MEITFQLRDGELTISKIIITIYSVQSLSRARLFVTPWITACQASLSITNSQSWLKLMSIDSVMPSNHLILCHRLLYLLEFAQIHSLSRWCHPTTSSSAIHFSSCLQSFPASGSFPVSCLFASRGQSIGASTSASVLPIKIQGWFSLRLSGLISLREFIELKSLLQHHNSKHQFFGTQSSLWSNSHIRTWLLEKPYLWLCGPFSAKWCLCFLMHCLGLL